MSLFSRKKVYGDEVNYYGKLTQLHTIDLKYRHTLLHDIVQVISAQGIPPPDLEKWVAIYHAANCQLVHAYEGESSGIEWFIHVVQL